MDDGTATATWLQLGYFLIDAAAGMLAAPVTHPDQHPENVAID
ncbi:MAG: hypothetical protein QMB98_07395 [Flaviflexus sp.]